MTVQTLTIPNWVPDQITNGQPNWRVTWKARQRAKEMAWASAKQAGWTFVPGKVRLTIEYTFPVRRNRDHDNLVARSIGLVNGLKKTFFEDDSTDVLDLRVEAIVVPKQKQTRLVLEAIEEQAA